MSSMRKRLEAAKQNSRRAGVSGGKLLFASPGGLGGSVKSAV